jgi:hypothetical protein
VGAGASITVVRTLAAVLAVAIVAGCGGATVTGDRPAAGRDRALPDVARVVCDGETPRLAAPVVRPRTDGVYVVVRNTSGEWLSFSHPDGGDNAPPGTSRHVPLLPPGSARIGCMSDADWALDPPDESGLGRLRIEDPEGMWRGAVEFDCTTWASGIADYAPGGRGVPTRRLRADARRELRPRRGQHVEMLGYLARDERTVTIIRDGVSVRSVTYSRDARGWLPTETLTCDP